MHAGRPRFEISSEYNCRNLNPPGPLPFSSNLINSLISFNESAFLKTAIAKANIKPRHA